MFTKHSQKFWRSTDIVHLFLKSFNCTHDNVCSSPLFSGRSLNLDKLENTLDHRQSTEKNHTQFMPTSSKLITANNGAKGPIIKPKTSTESIANPTDLGLLVRIVFRFIFVRYLHSDLIKKKKNALDRTSFQSF